MQETVNCFVTELMDRIGNGTIEEVVENNRNDVVDVTSLAFPQRINPATKEMIGTVKQTSMDTRHHLNLAFPPSHFSERDNPLMKYYQACYEIVAAYTEQIYSNEDLKRSLLLAMGEAGINESNIDEFLDREWEIWARVMDLPQIAQVLKENPDYADFNRNKSGNYSLINAQKKIEHMIDGKLAEKVPLSEAISLEENEVQQWNLSLVTEEYLSVLSEEDRELLIDYANGKSLTELSGKYGYANASGVKKRLERIKKKILESFSKKQSAHL